MLIEAIAFPEIQPGELLAVPVSGAYQLSMASNYNGALRPAVLWLEDGTAQLIQERQQPEHLLPAQPAYHHCLIRIATP